MADGYGQPRPLGYAVLVHTNRLYNGKPDGCVNEELGRRLVLEVLDDAETVSAIKSLHLPADLAASKTSLTRSSSS